MSISINRPGTIVKPISKTIDLEGDGDFEIRLRSGNSSDNSEEGTKALREKRYAADQYKLVIEGLPDDYQNYFC